MRSLLRPLIVIALLVSVPAALLAQPAPQPDENGFLWTTVSQLNNPGHPGQYNTGRGSVSYRFRISRLETTTTQWMEFVNTFSTQNTPGWNAIEPAWWGGRRDFSFPGPGRRFVLDNIPNAGLVPLQGISWRAAALYCNWLHNGKGSDWASTQSGAYDASTFGYTPEGVLTDQLTRSPGARYWIPSVDEWLKASYYDPNKYGHGQGGWWRYPGMSEVPLIGGAPGIGQTSAGYHLLGSPEWDIPLGAYPQTQSAYGLWDTSGGMQEWMERRLPHSIAPSLSITYAGINPIGLVGEEVGSLDSRDPFSDGGPTTLRIASVIPAPAGDGVLILGIVQVLRRGKRRES